MRDPSSSTKEQLMTSRTLGLTYARCSSRVVGQTVAGKLMEVGPGRLKEAAVVASLTGAGRSSEVVGEREMGHETIQA